MASGISWEEFEAIIARLQTTFNKGATVTRDEKLPGNLSGRLRQIDVCIRTKVGTENVLIIVECKKLNRKVDVKAVESFIGVKKDVGAQMGIMVSSEGFSRSAYKRAKDENISLYRYQDTQKEDWPNGLETSALFEVWELTPLGACYVLADGTEEVITTDEDIECVDVRGGPKTGLSDVLREMWNSLESADRYERDWFVECPSSSPERSEITKLRLGARARFVRGLKKGRLHFEGLVNESEGQAKVAGWKMVFDGAITASAADAQFQLSPSHPRVVMDVKFVSSFDNEKIKAFFEKSKSFQLEASDLHADTTPVFEQLQSEFNSSKNAKANAEVIDGCVQISVGSGNQVSFFQVDGQWKRIAKRLSFEGQLRGSPLQIHLHRDILASGNLDPDSPIHFFIDWGVWQGQPLLTLPYFEDIHRFLNSDTFAVKCLANGSEIGRVEMTAEKAEILKVAREAVDWIARYRSAAKYLGVNPKFPFSNKLQSLPSDDAEVLAKLIESGVHEQPLTGKTFCVEGDSFPGVESLIKKQGLRIEQPGQICLFDFFGNKIRLCPVTYLFTEVELTSVKNVENNRVELTFTGGIGSIWRITYPLDESRNRRSIPR